MNKVYYGQYSLRYWVELMLNKKVILPEYQRYFVWSQEQTKELLQSLIDGRFVPPVTIGTFNDGTERVNLVIDGQQRLTSILLAYLNLFPDRASFKASIQKFADEDDAVREDGEDSFDNVLDWNFSKLTEKGNTKEAIKAAVAGQHYQDIDFGLEDSKLDSIFLGFSFLVPEVSDGISQQRYYTKVFRGINMGGTKLKPIESRLALYYINKDLEPLFKPAIMEQFSISKAVTKTEERLDFVRYLSLLCEYKKRNGVATIAAGYKTKMESYYEEYINSVIEIVPENKSSRFDDVFNANNYQGKMANLQTIIDALNLPKEYNSIINMDAYFLGLIYSVMILGKTIDTTRTADIKSKVEEKIAIYEGEPTHKKSPSALKYLRERILDSIDIYKEYELA